MTESKHVSAELAAHIAQTSDDAIPADACEAAKRFMLDTMAVAWAGSDAPGCDGAYQVLAEQGGIAESTVWAYGVRLPASSAAFLNSMFGAALDFDSMGRSVPSHVNIVVLPAALAVAQRTHASGKEFLSALVLGCDLMYRMGAASQVLNQAHRGWFYTSVHGVFAAAAACARVLKLDKNATMHALGIAYSQAAGTQQANIEPSLTKRMQSAFAARGGVFAALLAQRGITAPQAVFEGQHGLFAMYQNSSIDRLLDGLGRRYENGEFSIKKFPSCGCNHTAIEGALRIASEYDMRPQDIDGMEVEISPFMNRLVGGVFDPSGDPQAAAQFNIRYSIACAIIRRKFGLTELETAVVCDPAIAALAARTTVIVDPENKGSRGPMILRVRSKRHGEIVCRVENEPGSEQSPLSDAEIAAKCRECFALGVRPLTAAQTDSILERIARLELVPDMAGFFAGIH